MLVCFRNSSRAYEFSANCLFRSAVGKFRTEGIVFGVDGPGRGPTLAGLEGPGFVVILEVAGAPDVPLEGPGSGAASVEPVVGTLCLRGSSVCFWVCCRMLAITSRMSRCVLELDCFDGPG